MRQEKNSPTAHKLYLSFLRTTQAPNHYHVFNTLGGVTEGLAALVREGMTADSFSRAVYVFRVNRADRIRLIFWSGTGLCLFAKWLEDIRWPKTEDGVMRSRAAQFLALLKGLDWRRVHEARETATPTQPGCLHDTILESPGP